MKKYGGYKNIDPKGGVKFGYGQPRNKNGRKPKPSVYTPLLFLLEGEGEATFQAKDVKKINADGSVVLKIPTTMQLAMNIISKAMAKGGEKAIEMILDASGDKKRGAVNINTNNDGAVNVTFTDNSKSDDK